MANKKPKQDARLFICNIHWLGRRDSNPRMLGPKPSALPLGDSPLKIPGVGWSHYTIFKLIRQAQTVLARMEASAYVRLKITHTVTPYTLKYALGDAPPHTTQLF